MPHVLPAGHITLSPAPKNSCKGTWQRRLRQQACKAHLRGRHFSMACSSALTMHLYQ